MDIGKQKLSVKEAKEIDLVDYLSSLGHEAIKVRRNDYWYLSPLRDENTPSFKVNRKINKWYDHGTGQGGNLIDFAILYNHCTVGELLQSLSSHFSFQQPTIYQTKNDENREGKIIIVRESNLSSIPLLHYLEQRKISLQVAEQFCREVNFQLHGKNYYGIGFKNDSGGFEIRNPYFKGSSAPKNITTIKNNADNVLVFEGFMDFLSFIGITPDEDRNKYDFVILNSISLFEKARLFMEEHHAIHLYLDRDTTGQNCSRYALSLSNKYQDESALYKGYKDINDWVMHQGKSQKKNLTNKL